MLKNISRLLKKSINLHQICLFCVDLTPLLLINHREMALIKA